MVQSVNEVNTRWGRQNDTNGNPNDNNQYDDETPDDHSFEHDLLLIIVGEVKIIVGEVKRPPGEAASQLREELLQDDIEALQLPQQ